jgi:hypothetical protein
LRGAGAGIPDAAGHDDEVEDGVGQGAAPSSSYCCWTGADDPILRAASTPAETAAAARASEAGDEDKGAVRSTDRTGASWRAREDAAGAVVVDDVASADGEGVAQ